MDCNTLKAPQFSLLNVTLAQRVQRAREAAGLNKSELARAVGVEPSAITQWENGSTKALEGVNLVRAAEALRVNPRWLATGKGPMALGESPNVEEIAQPASSLPLISWVSAGTRSEAFDPYAPGAYEALIDFDSVASKSAFCLRIRGNSMVRPDGTGFPDGCLVAVEPKRLAKSGDFVVVRFEDSDEATFKQFFIEGALKYLRPLNPTYPTAVVQPDAHIVGVVFEKRIVEKF